MIFAKHQQRLFLGRSVDDVCVAAVCFLSLGMMCYMCRARLEDGAGGRGGQDPGEASGQEQRWSVWEAPV